MQKNFFYFSYYCLYSFLVFFSLTINAIANEPIQSRGSTSFTNTHTTESAFKWEKLDEGIFYMLRNEVIDNDLTSSNTQETNPTSFGNEAIANKDNYKLEKTKNPHILLHLVRVDPNLYNFNLYGSFLEGDKKKYTLPTWGKEKNLSLAINASMYLPDNTTSIGYMRSYDTINNDYISNAMDGFFLSNHKDEDCATFTDKHEENWQEELNNYNVIIQNFRILGNFDEKAQKAQVLWNKESGKHAISAYGNDIDGNIIFLFSQSSVSVNELAHYLIDLKSEGIIFKNLLYAEGGREAALYINSPKGTIYINGFGSTSLDFLTPVPNVLGVTKAEKNQ